MTYKDEQDAAAFWRKVDEKIAQAIKTATNAESGIVPGVIYSQAMFNAAGHAVWGGVGGILVSSATVSTPQTLANNTTTVIDFDNIVSDTGGNISGTGASWVFTAPRDGYYLTLFGNQTDTNTWSVGGREINASYKINGGGGYFLDRQWPVAGFAIAPFLQGVAVIQLAAADTLAIVNYHNRGSSIQTGSAGDCFIQVLSVG